MKDFLKWLVLGGIFISPFLVLLVTSSLFFPYITGKNFAFRIIVEVMCVAWVLLALYDTRYRPRFSWMLVGFGGLVIVMFFANLFGEYPLKSFWSNYERMDGYVTLIHTFLYFIVIGSVLTTEKLWNGFFNTVLGVAGIMSLYALAQYAGVIEISRGSGWRLEGTFGNSTYLAIYMLFNIAIAGLCMVRARVTQLRVLYGFLIALFVFILLQTGTRGTTLGLVGGGFLTALYITIFAHGHVRLRQIALTSLAGLLILGGLFWMYRDAPVIQSVPFLERIADITLDEGSIRFMVWEIALQGIADRPILGWGQENFSYVFNTYYTPELYAAEPWYDRVHNIVLDWLIAGGIVGAFFYFSIIGAVLWYILVRPLVQKDDTAFSVLERGIIFGLLGAYVFHNLFVFDNVVSYMFFGIILALVHSRVGEVWRGVQAASFKEKNIEQIYAPIGMVVLLGVIYAVNVPGILAARDMLDALRTDDPVEQFAQFDEALSRNSFANQEIREQMLQYAVPALRSNEVASATKGDIFEQVETEARQQLAEKPGDTRGHLLTGSFYRATGYLDKALEQFAVAQALSPQKQATYIEEAFVYLQQEDFTRGQAVMKRAYDLAPEYTVARVHYALASLLAGDRAQYEMLVADESTWIAFVENDVAIQSLYAAKEYEVVQEMLRTRIVREPENVQYRVSLAVSYYESGDSARAITVLEEAAERFPEFATQAEAFIEQIQTEGAG